MEGESTNAAVTLVNIDKEMREAYLDYAMSVITSRALPDVRDGLKPVQRRILYTMYDAGLRPDRAYKKSAATVGDVLGKYHPHGDSSVYDAMVRMAQDFSMRYMLIDGQGNFGSVDGDRAAAYRYTEARPSRMALELLADIDEDTVDWRPNYDDSRQEPTVLPARIPNLLINGASGIAVGMATNIPPHNLGEVCDALMYCIDHWTTLDDVTPEDIRQFIHGPDFPTGGQIVGFEGIASAYGTGRGRVIMRAKSEFEEVRGERMAIVVTEIPFQVNKSTLLERIAELARTKRIDTIHDLRDESDRDGMRIVIELKKGADAHSTLNRLLKYSQLQQTFGINTLALVDGQPTMLPLKRMLVHFLEHRREVIRRRSEHELEKARQRQHILEGLLKAISALDDVIRTIRAADDVADARDALMALLSITEVQAQAILDMQLRRLAALERLKIENEHAEITARINFLLDLLAHPEKVLGVIRDDLQDIKSTYGDPRRTEIVAGAGEFSEDDLIASEDVLVTLTDRGYIKRVPADTYRSQRRGGRGIIGARTRDEDALQHVFLANTRDRLLFFTDRGRVYQLRAHHIPASSREAAGTPLINLIQIQTGEKVTVAVAAPEWQFEHGNFLIMATRRGRIKRTVLSEYDGVRPSGLIAVNLDADDSLDWVKITTGEDELIFVTRLGMALRFHERTVRPMGRAAGGVNAMRLKKGDIVTAVDLVKPDADLFVITTKGFGKRSPLAEYRPLGRYNQGIRTIDIGRLDEIGEIVDARVVEDGTELTVITDRGIIIRTSTDEISRMGRLTRGVRVIRLDSGQKVAAVAYMPGRAAVDEDADEEVDGDVDGAVAAAPNSISRDETNTAPDDGTSAPTSPSA
ncbi:MAG: DNA gyrase subunit A [Ardenticatenales bacterium]|nr:DNA gyrase subunit A [Ardenticatenales bacterium]